MASQRKRWEERPGVKARATAEPGWVGRGAREGRPQWEGAGLQAAPPPSTLTCQTQAPLWRQTWDSSAEARNSKENSDLACRRGDQGKGELLSSSSAPQILWIRLQSNSAGSFCFLFHAKKAFALAEFSA